MTTTPPPTVPAAVPTATPGTTGTGAREPRRVGAVRPSQLIHTYGIGSLVDLPHMSVIVSGIDRWDSRYQANVVEPRLTEALRQVVGTQLDALRHAPRDIETNNYWDDWAWIGVPAYPFPRWLRCASCKRLDRIDKGVFEIDIDPVRTHRSRYFHDCSGKKHDAQPVRVVAACPAGHLDDFPWEELVHSDHPCSGTSLLELRDTPGGSRATDQKAVCLTCGQEFPVRQAFSQTAASIMPGCRGRHPHLDSYTNGGCGNSLVAQLVGASNAWFPVFKSALSLPSGDSPLDEAVAAAWHLLEAVTAKPMVDVLMRTEDCRPLREWTADEVWAAIEKRQSAPDDEDAEDLLLPEWRVLTNPHPPSTEEFHSTQVGPPAKYTSLANVVAVDRLREVAALFGFTRIASPDDADDAGGLIANRAPIAVAAPTWLPASETRGEGIFIKFPEQAVVQWEAHYDAEGRYP
ncbi:MAG TPA: DrmB family protein, partial [Acidimicrobiales bacterium]|nr:DrmB family protein [Acidimicrobiales bacterium]